VQTYLDSERDFTKNSPVIKGAMSKKL